MARGSSKQTQRVQVSDPQLRPPRIEEHTRYVDSRGNRNGVHAANALRDAFKVGQQIAEDHIVKQNIEGVDRAVAARAQGQERDESDENFGYNKAWDQLDAEYDLNLAKAELPEILRGLNAEEQDENVVQEAITGYFEDMFGGVEQLGKSEYAKALAPGLLQLETELIAQHRQAKIEQVREEQRTKIYANTEAAFRETGELDYQKLFDQSGTFFEGPDKKLVLWETVFDLAIETGRPDLIENMPTQINGIPTGSKDPEFLDEKRAALNAATTKAGRLLAEQDAALKANNEQALKDAQLLLVDRYIAGEPVDMIVDQIRVNPESTFSDITAAINFSQTELTYAEDTSPDMDGRARLWSDIYTGRASMSDVITFHNAGGNGFGDQANSELRSMLAAVSTQSKGSGGSDGPTITAYRNELNQVYNPQLQGALGPIDQTMHQIRVEAISDYNRRVIDEGQNPREAMLAVREQFDAAVDRIKPAALSATGQQSQSTNAQALGLTITKADAVRFANGEMSYEAFIGTRSQPELILQLSAIGDELGQETLEQIAQRINNP